MDFKKLLSSYASKEARAPPPPPKPAYKHALHDTLEAIWERRTGKSIGADAGAGADQEVGTEAEGMTGDASELGLLFIIIDKLPYEALWRLWLEQAGALQPKVRIWIHAKFPDRVSSLWVRERLCRTFQLKPEWGSLELTDVMVRLLKEAVEDPEGRDVSHFCYVSESCVPIVPLAKTFEEIGIRSSSSSSSSSWLNYNHTATNGYAQQGQFDVLKGVIPSQCTLKADQWILLSRAHAQLVLALPQLAGQPLLPLFKKVRASDEMYFPCCLSLVGCIRGAGTVSAAMAGAEAQAGAGAEAGARAGAGAGTGADEPPAVAVQRRLMTWCDWSDKGKNPREYVELSAAAVAPALAKGCLFFRKLKADTHGEALLRLVQRWGEVVLPAEGCDVAGLVERARGMAMGRGGWGTDRREGRDQEHRRDRSRSRDRDGDEQGTRGRY